ncbi:MAG: phosphotransferase family protein, partial [Ilumatobacter sp.]
MGAPTDSGVDTPIGIEPSAVSAWLDENVPGAQGPYRFEVIAGGHSNLTFSVIGSDGRRMVLRRPPLSHGLASAHDMGREHRVISGLATSSLPVPTTLGMCDDESVNGAPFYVIAHVDGTVIRDEETARSALDSDGRSNASRSLIDNLAALHAIDPHDVGLEGLGRHDGYLARQLKRWYGQWNAQKTRDLPLVDEVHDALLA